MARVVVPTFETHEILLTVAAGLALIGGILMAVTTGVAWGSIEEGITVDLKFWEVESCFDGCYSADYSDSDFDGEDGTGLVRAAGPLMVVGIVLAFLGMATLTTSLFVRDAFLTLSGTIGSGVAFLFLLIGLILMPIGMTELVPDTDISWGAGLILAVIGTVFVGGAVGTGLTAHLTSDLS